MLRFGFTMAMITIFALMVGCAPSVTVKTDYDHDQNFSDYKTYTWWTGQQPDDDLSKAPLVKKRVITSVDKTMQAKGFTLVEAADADLTIVIHAGVKERMQVTNWSGGYGWYDPWWGPYGGRTDVSYYEQGTLVIDLVDTKDKSLAWRGMGTSMIQNYEDAEAQQKFLDSTVDKIMKDFPPQSK
ncbi:MAG: DUF4136 domain-containing protein [Calditrichales bacterium]|nr:MAG: DUF4136 domain-containing protein [Calditrichales bacterium]